MKVAEREKVVPNNFRENFPDFQYCRVVCPNLYKTHFMVWKNGVIQITGIILIDSINVPSVVCSCIILTSDQSLSESLTEWVTEWVTHSLSESLTVIFVWLVHIFLGKRITFCHVTNQDINHLSEYVYLEQFSDSDMNLSFSIRWRGTAIWQGGAQTRQEATRLGKEAS